MAQTYTAKGTAAAKSSGTTLTIPDFEVESGDNVLVGLAWDLSGAINPDHIKLGKSNIDIDGAIEGQNIGAAPMRMRVYHRRFGIDKIKDLVATWPENVNARAMVACVLKEAGAWTVKGEDENLAATFSHTGSALDVDHINTINFAWHVTNGPVGDATGSSSTGHTLGQRIGTSGDADTTNITIQETYKIMTAITVTALSGFTIGNAYQIKTVGDTNWVAIGAASNTVGVQFTATGVGSGTGDAYYLDDQRSRITGLAVRDHMGIMVDFKPSATFTVESSYHRPWISDSDSNIAVLKVLDENSNLFKIRIDKDLVKIMTDQEIKNYITEKCGWFGAHHLDDTMELIDVDDELETRLATLEGFRVIY